MSNDKMQEAFEKWITTEAYPGYAIGEIDAGSLNLAVAAWQAALSQQPESEPAYYEYRERDNITQFSGRWKRCDKADYERITSKQGVPGYQFEARRLFADCPQPAALPKVVV